MDVAFMMNFSQLCYIYKILVKYILLKKEIMTRGQYVGRPLAILTLKSRSHPIHGWSCYYKSVYYMHAHILANTYVTYNLPFSITGRFVYFVCSP